MFAAAPDAPPGSTPIPMSRRRWPIGSAGAIWHGALLALILPIVAIALFTLLGPYLPTPDSHSRDGSLGAFMREFLKAGLGVGVFIGVCLLAVGRLRWRDLGWGRCSGRDVLRGLIGFALTAAVFLAVILLTTDMTMADIWAYQRGVSVSERLQFVLIGVSASLTEESLFRGYLQPSLCKRLGPAAGVGLTALLFSLMHLPTNVVSFVGRLVLGLGMGITRGAAPHASIWPSAIVHTLIWIVLGAM